MKKNKELKAVDWVRKVRNSNVTRLKHLNLEEFAATLSKEAKSSKLWNEIKSKKGKIGKV
jgi:hypothetical protein